MTFRAHAVAVALATAAIATCACRSRSEAPRVSTVVQACSTSASCAAGEYCAFEPQLCGKAKRPGTCRSIPVGCKAYAPVCGCDGNVYPHECAAHAARVDLDVAGGCRADVPDFVHCGPRFCNARESYCEIYLSDVGDPPTDHACKPLPPACVPDAGVARGCECFPAGTPCLSFCGPMPTGGLQGLHLTCQGVKKPAR